MAMAPSALAQPPGAYGACAGAGATSAWPQVMPTQHQIHPSYAAPALPAGGFRQAPGFPHGFMAAGSSAHAAVPFAAASALLPGQAPGTHLSVASSAAPPSALYPNQAQIILDNVRLATAGPFRFYDLPAGGATPVGRVATPVGRSCAGAVSPAATILLGASPVAMTSGADFSPALAKLQRDAGAAATVSAPLGSFGFGGATPSAIATVVGTPMSSFQIGTPAASTGCAAGARREARLSFGSLSSIAVPQSASAPDVLASCSGSPKMVVTQPNPPPAAAAA
eukprot:TRINITY_DN21673_c0_g1_i1.p1 TRINITY_DN21673_c0_g1~~TRINITY_DN21673_c0_g1_i1.p1  ORF type:complete len:281 (-),score=48.56 TRINITY_DN21673_c0_g1_i1:69-911(-)